MSDVETVERFIPAPAEAIFAIISNPRRHHEIDGSGTVRDAKDVPEEIHLGSRFGMSMKLGMPYSMVSEVVEFEPNRLIAWQTRPPSDWAARLGGGRIWRYELEPREGGTLVRESWDITHERLKVIVRPARKRTRAAMTATLERIDQILSAP
jgi:uncharacterized protein YndB with AHSA1/START domain